MTGKRCPRCGETKPRSEFNVGGRCKPCDKEHTRKWKQANPERAKEYARRDNAKRHKAKLEWAAKQRAPCPRCGKPMGSNSALPSYPGRSCLSCMYEERAELVAERGHQIEKWWAEGLPQKQIAERLGWTKGHLNVEINRLRGRGFKLPYRNKSGKRHPDQVAA